MKEMFHNYVNNTYGRIGTLTLTENTEDKVLYEFKAPLINDNLEFTKEMEDYFSALNNGSVEVKRVFRRSSNVTSYDETNVCLVIGSYPVQMSVFHHKDNQIEENTDMMMQLAAKQIGPPSEEAQQAKDALRELLQGLTV